MDWLWEPDIETLTFCASLVAIVLSLFALMVHRSLEREASAQTLIHAQYELCRELDLLRVDHPEVSHMLALPALSGDETWKNYHLFKKYVRLLQPDGPTTQAARARMYLQEHATALDVCNIYEQTLQQRDLAVRDARRFKVLDALAKYYEERMLRSPRLRFHWDHGASDMMEPSTRARYDANVRNSYSDDWMDHKSPLDD